MSSVESAASASEPKEDCAVPVILSVVPFATETPPVAQTPARSLDRQEQAVYDLLLEGDLDFDALCERSKIPADELGGLLMEMELDGIVETLPGLRYRLA